MDRRAVFEPLERRELLSANPLISEVVARNDTGLLDYDFDHSDWFEIHNRGTSAVNLNGWHFTDDLNNTTKWQVPVATVLGPDERLVVFASNEDSVTPNGELHTNFRFASEGEFIGLADPTGQLISSIDFPAQSKDVSFGIDENVQVTPLVTRGAAAQAFVPANGSLGDTWRGSDEPFDDSSWMSGATGAGYETGQVGATVGLPIAFWTFDELRHGNTVAPDARGSYDSTVFGATLTTGQQGRGGEALSFDGNNDYVLPGIIPELVSPDAFSISLWFRREDDHSSEAEATNHSVNNVLIAQASDFDNDNLEIGTKGDTVQVYLDTAEWGGAVSPVSHPAAIQNTTWHHLVMSYNSSADQELQLYVDGILVGAHDAYGGLVTSSGLSPFTIGLSRAGGTEFGDFEGLIDEVAVWDVALDSQHVTALYNAASPLLLTGYQDLIGIDLATTLQNNQTSSYVRIPFNVTSPDSFEWLKLQMHYDDAFVAWINGTEVARSGITGPVEWNSAATTERSDAEALLASDFFVANTPGLLAEGENTLAVQLLNFDPGATRSIILPELDAFQGQRRQWLLEEQAPATAHVPTDGTLGTSWTGSHEPFYDTSWFHGKTGVGYDSGPGGPSEGPLAYWTFDSLEDNDSTVPDAMNNYHGAVNGATLTTGNQGKFGEALAFDGDNDSVSAGVIAELLNPSAFTTSLWFRRMVDHAGESSETNHDINNVLIAQSSAGSNDNLEIGTEGDMLEIYLDTNDLGGANPPVREQVTLQNNHWHHLVVTYDSQATSEMTLYWDGIPTKQYEQFGGLVSHGGMSPFSIGIARPGENAWGDFEGLIDDVAIWDSALTAAQVMAIFDGTSPLLLSGYNDLIGLNVATPLASQHSSTYVRVPFTVDDPDSVIALNLKLQYDDAAVAYINGHKVVSHNFTGVPQFNSLADTERPDGNALAAEESLIINQPGLLQAGSNVLAIQVINANLDAERLLILPTLEAITVPDRSFAFMETPTPGTVNSEDFAAVATLPDFSAPAGTFHDPFQLVLTTEHVNGKIHYTTDRSLPTESSPLYTNPLVIDQTTMVRARVYVPDLVPSESTSQTYVELGTQLLDVSSNLPIIVIDNFGQGDLTNGLDLTHRQFQNGSLMLFEPDSMGRSHLADSPTFTSRMGSHRRGNSSFSNAKPSLRVELRDEHDNDLNAPLLGLSDDSDWILSGPYDEDRSLIRNAFVHAINQQTAPWAPATRFVEFYYNTNGGALDSTSEYMGLYALKEHVKINSERIDIASLSPNDNLEPAVTGGYLFEINNPKVGDLSWKTTRSQAPFIHIEPHPDTLTLEQQNYIQAYVQDFENAAFSADFKNPETGYRAFLDTDSLINHHMLRFLVDEPQGFVVSEFWFKDRGGKLQQGPVWDSDRALGNPHDQYDFFPTPTRMFTASYFNPPAFTYEAVWLRQLFLDENFVQDWVDRWQELRQDIFTVENFHALIDTMAGKIAEAQLRNQQRWQESFNGPYPEAEPGLSGWDAEISQIKGWLAARLDFVDSLLLPPIQLTAAVGASSPFEVTLSAPQGTIYYTLDGSDPRATSGQVSTAAIPYSGLPIPINETSRIIARTFDPQATPLGGTQITLSEWSAPATQEFRLDFDVVITEINYNPHAATDEELAIDPNLDNDDFEYIEFHNKTDSSMDLAGLQLTKVDVNGDQQGIDFIFSSQTLSAGERIVVVKNRSAFQQRYGTEVRIADGNDGQGGGNGEYGGRLSNAGERVTFLDQTGITVHAFDYGDSGNWPLRADGNGSSIEVVDSSLPLNDANNWQPSTEHGGSPGTTGVGPLNSILINEVLTRTELPNMDAIELYNPTDSAIDIGGWFLSDKATALGQYVISSGTIIPAGAYLVFDQNQFSFGLNSTSGDQVWLVQPNESDEPQWIVDQVQFGAAASGISWGRFPNGTGELFPLVSPTLAANNNGPRFGPIVISELMYHPSNPSDSAAPTSLEFVELYNPTTATVDLSGWKISGIDYEFPEGTTIASAAFLVVVPFDPVSDLPAIDAFNTSYDVNMAALPNQYLGPYSGRLDNGGETITLLRAEDAGADETVPLLIEDQVIFDDADPWPIEADGGGLTLHRQLVDLWGNDPSSWGTGTPSAGSFGPGSVSTFAGAEVGTSIIGETGTLENVTHVSQVVILNHTFNSPVVFAQPASYNGTDPVAIRISDIQSDRFTIRLTEPSNENGLHNAAERISYLVVEAGNHQLVNGKSFEVGTVSTTATVGMFAADQWETVHFTSTFGDPPVVISQIQSNHGPDFLYTRQRQTGLGQVDLALEMAEIYGAQQTAETVGYLAMDAGMGSWNGLLYEARSTTSSFNQDFQTLDFGQTFAEPPNFLAALGTRQDSNNAHLRSNNLTTTGVDLKAKEDTTWDAEEIHSLRESISFLAIGGAGLLTIQGGQISNGATRSFTITIPGDARISDLDIILDIEHTHTADLGAFLIAPDGTSVELFTHVGGAGTNFTDTILDDEASLALVNATPPFSGRFQPQGTLSDFAGTELGGTWTLQISDDPADPTVGRLRDWSLVVNTTSSPTGNVNHDSEIDANDIDLLYANLNSNDVTFDLNSDSNVDVSDVDELLLNLIQSQRGDTDLDLDVDATDFHTVVANFDPLGQNETPGWAMGNFDGDNDIDISDFNQLVTHFSPGGLSSSLQLRTLTSNTDTLASQQANAVIATATPLPSRQAAQDALHPPTTTSDTRLADNTPPFAESTLPHHMAPAFDSGLTNQYLAASQRRKTVDAIFQHARDSWQSNRLT